MMRRAEWLSSVHAVRGLESGHGIGEKDVELSPSAWRASSLWLAPTSKDLAFISSLSCLNFLPIFRLKSPLFSVGYFHTPCLQQWLP
jgi:hypothetical protein